MGDETGAWLALASRWSSPFLIKFIAVSESKTRIIPERKNVLLGGRVAREIISMLWIFPQSIPTYLASNQCSV